jgi:hypothetical protein
MAAVVSPYPRPHRGHGGPGGRVRADLVDVHDADPGHGPGRVWEAEDVANGGLAADG